MLPTQVDDDHHKQIELSNPEHNETVPRAPPARNHGSFPPVTRREDNQLIAFAHERLVASVPSSERVCLEGAAGSPHSLCAGTE